MAENNKGSIHSDLENNSSETKDEIPLISDQPAQTSNTGQLEKPPEDTKTANTPKDEDINSPPKYSILSRPIHQDRHSLPTNLSLPLPAHQGRTPLSLPPPTHQGEYSSTAKLKTSEVESLSPTSRNKSENKKSHAQLGLERGESSETKAEIPVIPEKNPQTVSTSNSEQTAEFVKETMPKPVDNTSSGIAKPLPILLPTVHQQHVQDMLTDSAMERAPSTSSNDSPRKVKQSHEGLDRALVDQVQKLELVAKTVSPESMSKSPSKGLYIKSKGNNDQTRDLPLRVRKTGLTTVWNQPDKDFVPNLAIPKGTRPSSIPQQNDETFPLSDFQCHHCHRAILGNALEILCQQCLEDLQRVDTAPQEPEGACGGATSDPHYFQEGATAAPFEEDFPESYSDFKETYERRSSVEDYLWMRHRQRAQGLHPFDNPLQGATNQQLEGAYGDYERSDSEEDYRNLHFLRSEIMGALPRSQQVIFEEMRLAESEIFAALSRPGETFEDLRNPEQEIFEAQHYDRQMAKLAARFGGAPLEETTFPWKPQEFPDQETLYKLWRPPPDPVEKDEVEDMSPETRRRHELERMALMRTPREHAEKLLEQKDESEESGSESEDEDTEESLPYSK